MSPVREDLMEKPLSELIVGALFSQHSFSARPQAALKKVKQLFMGQTAFPLRKQLPVVFLFWKWIVSEMAFHLDGDAF